MFFTSRVSSLYLEFTDASSLFMSVAEPQQQCRASKDFVFVFGRLFCFACMFGVLLVVVCLLVGVFMC